MLKVWLNALNLTERPSFVGGNVEEDEYKAGVKNSGQLEITRTFFFSLKIKHVS